MAGLEQVELTDSWIEKTRSLAPKEPRVAPARTRSIVVFSQCKGYQHWVTPHTSALLQVLGEETGAFQVTEVEDPEFFVPENLTEYDAVVFNNTCAERERRDLFYDFLEDEARSAELQENIINFVADGGGYVGIHGACCAFMGSAKWEEMQGGSFAYHPAQQEVRLTLVEPDHPLSAAWGGSPFVHVDEPYILTNSFTHRRIRPLLYMDTAEMEFGDHPRPVEPCYPAYTKPHGSGRVFYCSPSHNAQSFEDPRLLQFILDGIQYAVGDLDCDDSPR